MSTSRPAKAEKTLETRACGVPSITAAPVIECIADICLDTCGHAAAGFCFVTLKVVMMVRDSPVLSLLLTLKS
jgi:hypothetical protein